MTHHTILHGYIDEEDIPLLYYRRNDERIAALPECAFNNCPLITRDLFAIPRRVTMGRLIPFGAYYNGVEGHWNRWREEFEALLRDFYWWQVHVWVETDRWGDYHAIWTQLPPEREAEELNDTVSNAEIEHKLQPTALWSYRGPTRNVLR